MLCPIDFAGFVLWQATDEVPGMYMLGPNE